MLTMCLRQIARLVAAVLLTVCGLLSAPITTAAAQPCPDVEAVFARGTGEPPGVGGIGEPFVDSLRSAIGAKSLDVYPVNYEASSDFGDRIQFAQSVVDGIKDASGHIEATAANCPKTRIVLGGYSQGAAVAGFVTSASIPAGVPAEYVQFLPKPMPPEIANHVAAVTLFGKPSAEWLQNTGHRRSSSARCTRPRPTTCARPGTRSATAMPVGRRASRTLNTRPTA